METRKERARVISVKPLWGLIGVLVLLSLVLLGRPTWGQKSVAASPLGCDELIGNGDFETGDFSSWEVTGGPWVTSDRAHGGSYGALLGGVNDASHAIQQQAVLSSTVTTATLTYWWYIDTDEASGTPYDYLHVEIQDTVGEVLQTLETLSNESTTGAWQYSYIDLTEYPALLGQTVRVVFRCTTDVSYPTGFFVDDVELEVCEEVCPDTYEPNDEFGEPWPVDPEEIVESYLCDDGDVDYFGLSVEAGQEFQVTLDGPSALAAAAVTLGDLPADYDLYLYDPAGEEVAYADGSGLMPESITHVAAMDGVYRAKVIVKSGNSVAVDPYRFRWRFVTAWVVNATADHDDGVCEPLSSGDCTLREALNQANASNVKQVKFNIPTADAGYQGNGCWIIQPATALPALTGGGIVVDGDTQASFIGGDPNPQGPEIRLDGGALGAGGVGLYLTSDGNTVRGLSVTDFDDAAIRIEGARLNQVLGNTIGLEPLGDSVGNGYGVAIADGAQENRIGGRPEEDRNVIGGNTYSGVWIAGSGAMSNTVVNNYIGVDASGSGAVANGEDGVTIAAGAEENVIGGADDADRNLIGGNLADGVSIAGSATTGNRVLGNYIGVDASGAAAVGNGGNGVAIETDAHDNWIGDQGAGNLISGNGGNGVELMYALNNHVRGNYIGVDVSGSNSISNTNWGVHISGGQGNVIGGSIRNVISGNGSHGIVVWWGARENTIAGNRIGVNASSSKAVPNGGAGVYLGEGAQDNTIGGTGYGDRNVISGNATDGISMYDPGTDGNKVQGNYIGLNFYGSAAIPNGGAGVFISNSAAGNLVGGAVSGAPNVISGNGGHGVAVIDLAVGNTVSRNSIYDNGGEGIHLDTGGNASLSPPALVTITRTGSQYTIRGTTCGGCTVEIFSDDGDEGRRYEGETVADGSGNFSATVSRGRRYFTLSATNSTGSTSEFSRDALPDLVATGLEVTQAIQDLDNSVFLVENKRTHARFHVRADSLLGDDAPGVTAQLYAHKSTDGGSTWTLLGPLAPSNTGARITVRANPQRALRDDSFYFELPPAWRTGMVTLEATVNPANQAVDLDTGNNQYKTPKVLSYVKVPAMRLHLFEVTHTFTETVGGVPTQMTTQVTAAQLGDIEGWLRAAYPIHSLSVRRRKLNYNGPTDRRPDGRKVNNQLGQLWAQARKAKSHPESTFYYGVAGDCNGRCFMRGWGSGYIASGPVGVPDPRSNFGWDTDGNYGDWYAGHELGHCLGRPHTRGAVPAAGQCGAEGGPVTQYPDGRIGGPITTPNRFAGWDVRTQRGYPSTWTDIMTYCGNQWISDITYKAMAERLNKLGSAARTRRTGAAAPVETFFVVGSINLTQGAGEMGPGYRWMSDEAPTAPEPGEFSLRLEDGGGAVLSETSFAVEHLDPPPQDEDEVVPFQIEVLFDSAAARIVLLDDGVELASRQVSAHAPALTVTAPNGGETVTDTVQVAWQGDDADGDPLSYSVQYSCDGGATWEPLAADLAETSFNLDTTALPGGEQCLLRVLATDGVNVGEDQSNGAFTVTRKAPSVRILFPGGGWYTPAQTVVVEGVAYDLEDGDLSGDALLWSSDVDGVLGSGGSQAFSDLTPGEHTITLTAADSDEGTGSDSITIQVSETWPEQVYLPLVVRGW